MQSLPRQFICLACSTVIPVRWVPILDENPEEKCEHYPVRPNQNVFVCEKCGAFYGPPYDAKPFPTKEAFEALLQFIVSNVPDIEEHIGGIREGVIKLRKRFL